MRKKYVLQRLTDQCGRVFFPLDDEDTEEYFESYEEAERRLMGLQKKGICSTITELEVDRSIADDSE
jgi:hypothetical protein